MHRLLAAAAIASLLGTTVAASAATSTAVPATPAPAIKTGTAAPPPDMKACTTGQHIGQHTCHPYHIHVNPMGATKADPAPGGK